MGIVSCSLHIPKHTPVSRVSRRFASQAAARAALLLSAYLHLRVQLHRAPIILRGVTGFSIVSLGVLMAINGLLGVVSMTVNATHSDHTRERRWHLMIPLLIMAAAFLVTGSTKDPWWVVPAFAVAITGLRNPGNFLRYSRQLPEG